MAPRRNNSGHSALDVQSLLIIKPDLLNSQSPNSFVADEFTQCCVPNECLKLNTNECGLIHLKNLQDCVHILCSNDNCTIGQYMHRDCFEVWEESVLMHLKSTGKARSWTDRQRLENLWTKKGYDLVYRVCACKCGKGYMKKDLDWSPSASKSILGHLDEEAMKKKKKRNRSQQKTNLTLNTANIPIASLLGNNTAAQLNGIMSIDSDYNLFSSARHRAISLSSADGCISPPTSASSDNCYSPVGLMTKHKSYSERDR